MKALVLLAAGLCAAGACAAAQVELFSPRGEAKSVRQVLARFSEPMVAFGDPQLPDPFEVDCVAAGRGSWADPKNWVYDFARDLPAGLRCSFRLKASLASAAGAAMTGEQAFEFSTGGPQVLATLPYEGGLIDEEQAFLLGLDAPATEASLVAAAYCDVRGVNERVPVRMLSAEERGALLRARRDFVDRWLRERFGGGAIEIDGREFRRGARLEQFLREGGIEKLPIVALQCQRRLPNNAEVRLVWGRGIASESGVESSHDQAFAWKVRDSFQAKFSCERANRESQCLPMLPMRLSFTAPVPRSMAEKIVLRPQAGKPLAAEPGHESAGFVDEVRFSGPFPERAQFSLEIPSGLTDDAGRGLVNQKRFPLAVRTDEAPPLAKFPARFGIIELKGDGMLPVTLRNLEAVLDARTASVAPQGDQQAELSEKADAAINWLKNKLDESRQGDAPVPASYSRVADGDLMAMLGWLKRLRELERDRWRYDEKQQQNMLEYRVGEASVFGAGDRTVALKVPRPGGGKTFDVVGIPLKKPGFYVVELASPRLGASLLGGRPRPYYAQSAALVTNLAVHLKWGREGSLVWVTALDTGAPVPKARVAVQDCSGKVHFRGETDAQGRARIGVALPGRDQLPACLTDYDRQLVVSARLGPDLSFVMSDWNEGIARWRYNLRDGGWNGPYIAATVFDRSLLRAGETIAMKHYFRRHGSRGLSFVSTDNLPRKIVIRHQGSDDKYELPVHWDYRNSAETSWKIPPGAKKGVYFVTMTDTLDVQPGSTGNTRTSGSFRVEEFRVPLMKAVISGPKAAQVDPRSVALDLHLGYLSGGGAGKAPVRVRGVVQPRAVSFPDYDGFVFANGKVVEGVEQRGENRWFAEDEAAEESDPEAQPTGVAAGIRPLQVVQLDLDAAGAGRATLAGIPASDSPQELNAELEYADPNGEVLTTSTRVPLWPARIVLGIKADSWASSQDQMRFQVVALDTSGRPVKSQAVKVQLHVRNAYSHRKRLIGGFYGYENGAEVKKLDAACEGVTDDRGRLDCSVKSPVSGNILLSAQAIDRDGRIAWANASAWVAGKEAWWFDQGNDDRIDVIPERKRYEPGETAQLQVRMPFRQATALVTVEREGVIESFVQPLSGTSPVVRLPIKGSYAPNAFVSVLVVRGRVGDVQPTALVDLGKPAFKMGVTEISVGWKAHELGVKVSADKAVYKTRQTARVTVQVMQRATGKPPKSGEVTLAAVDEGLLELLPNDSWKLLEAMMQPRGIEVDTATAAMQVVGKRHYGRKALAHGGGGGRETSRELFDTLLLWKARVPLDAKGRAVVDVPLNDSLSGFRIVAVADADSGLFGTGQATIRTSQDLMLLSGVPPLVREGDRFLARFTARNASNRPLDVEVNGNVEGQALPAVRLQLDPGSAREAKWEVRVPAGSGQLRWELAASEAGTGGQAALDRLKVQQKVVAAVPVRTYQAALAQLEQPLELALRMPADALPGRGGVSVGLQPRLGTGLAGVREFMAAYPYNCLEQQASRAVALRDRALWDRTVDGLPSYLDREGFAKYFSVQREGSDTLTAYLLALAHESGWPLPPEARDRMLGALKAFVGGRAGRDSPMPGADLTIRKLAALDALSRYAPVETTLVDPIDVAPPLWPTSALLDWIGVLQRSPGLAERDTRLEEAEQVLRTRLDFRGSTLGFSSERTDYLWWLMVSGDANANRLLLAFLDAPQWREDLPRLVRGSLGRQQRGHWGTTVANAWGVLAMEKFGAKFEQEPVAGQVQAQLEAQHKALDWSRSPAGGTLDFAWPAQETTLEVRQDGTGKPWATVRSRAAIPLREPVSSGYRITRTVTPVDVRVPGELRAGDTVRVRLELDSQSDMTWVVVEDPIPAGAAILGTGLGGSSRILTQGEQASGFVAPAFEERGFESFRAYYRFVPKGGWSVEYTLRLGNPGQFELPPSRVEAMYAPEMFGELPNATVSVHP